MWIENKSDYRKRQLLCAILGICVSLFLVTVIGTRQEMNAYKKLQCAQKEIADEVLRFHVLANSDSEEDQKLKLTVRDEVLMYLEEAWEGDPLHETASGKRQKEKICQWVLEHSGEIEDIALAVIHEEGYDYPVSINVVKSYFPDRRYGNILFPKGVYEALRVEIGAACGHNWWCVLYPSLCFTDATCAVVTDEGEQELKGVLSEETFEMMTDGSTDFKIKSYFCDWLKERTKD